MRRYCGGDTELFRSVLSTFLDSVPAQIQSMRKAVGEQRWDALGRLSHNLKGSSATIGAAQLHAIAVALQQAATARDESLASSLVARLGEEFERFRIAAVV